jgi:hypothetical protein
MDSAAFFPRKIAVRQRREKSENDKREKREVWVRFKKRLEKIQAKHPNNDRKASKKSKRRLLHLGKIKFKKPKEKVKGRYKKDKKERVPTNTIGLKPNVVHIGSIRTGVINN